MHTFAVLFLEHLLSFWCKDHQLQNMRVNIVQLHTRLLRTPFPVTEDYIVALLENLYDSSPERQAELTQALRSDLCLCGHLLEHMHWSFLAMLDLSQQVGSDAGYMVKAQHYKKSEENRMLGRAGASLQNLFPISARMLTTWMRERKTLARCLENDLHTPCTKRKCNNDNSVSPPKLRRTDDHI